MGREGVKRPSVGRVAFSSTREVLWEVSEGQEWSSRAGGEYHTVGLPDGRIALLRWMGAKSDPQGNIHESLCLGALKAGEPGLSRIDLPVGRGEPVFAVSRHELRGAFWQDPRRSLQVAYLTATGDKLREWLYLPINRLNRHLGIFAQSGSGKSYSVSRLIEEMLIKIQPMIHTKGRRVQIVILDPNGDFRNFSGLRNRYEILLDLERAFKRIPGFVPDRSWREWVEKKIIAFQSSSNINSIDAMFDGDTVGKVMWQSVDLQGDDGRQAYRVLEKVGEYIFARRDERNRQDLTFILIDEAHNIVPNELKMNYGSENRLYAIVNKIAAEGRKYGAYLIIISQSPSKIHRDTLSQCANLMVMKMTTEEDIRTIASMRTDVPRALVERVGSFEQGEALFIGEWVPAPVTGRTVGRLSKEGGAGPRIA